MRDENERGSIFATGEFPEELQEIFAGDGIEAGARLVENEQARARHESAGDEDALTLALGEELPLAVDEPRGAEETHQFFSRGDVGARGGEPKVELRVAAADDGLDGGLGGGDARLQGAGDNADLETQLAPVGLAVALAEEGDVAGAGRKIAKERF